MTFSPWARGSAEGPDGGARTTVDEHVDAGDEARLVGQQEAHDGRELLGARPCGAAGSCPRAPSSSAAARTPGVPSACRSCPATPSRCARRPLRTPPLPGGPVAGRPASPTRTRCPGRARDRRRPPRTPRRTRRPWDRRLPHRRPGSPARSGSAAIEAKHTTAVPPVTSGRSASTSRAVPPRSTSRMRRQSAIVGEIPATCATRRSAPLAFARSARCSYAGRVGEVDDDRLARRAGARPAHRVRGDGRVVDVGQQQHVDRARQPLRARGPDAAAGPGHDRHRRHRTSPATRGGPAGVIGGRSGGREDARAAAAHTYGIAFTGRFAV